MTSDLGVIFFFFLRDHPSSQCLSVHPWEKPSGVALIQPNRGIWSHTPYEEHTGFGFRDLLFLQYFLLSNVRNREGHRADYIGYMQAAFRLPSRALSVQFRPDRNSPELNLSFTLSFLSMKNIYWGLS